MWVVAHTEPLHFRIAALKLFHVMIFEIELLKTAILPIKKKNKKRLWRFEPKRSTRSEENGSSDALDEAGEVETMSVQTHTETNKNHCVSLLSPFRSLLELTHRVIENMYCMLSTLWLTVYFPINLCDSERSTPSSWRQHALQFCSSGG